MAGARHPSIGASAAVLLAACLVYANTLGHDFVWDDRIWLEQKIRFYDSPADVFFEPPELPTFRVYRPLAQGTYWLDQLVWWRNPFGFHLTSVLLHAANAVLLLWLCAALGAPAGAALVAALLFAVHPVHTQAVAWITNRVDVLAAGGAMLALYAFRRARAGAGWWALATVALGTFAAAASKETGCVTPLLLLAAALTLAPPGSTTHDAAPAARTAGAAPAPNRRATVLGLAASLAGLAVYFALRPGGRTSGIAPDTLLELASLRDLLASFGVHVLRALAPLQLDAHMAEPPTGALPLATGALALAAAAGLLWAPPRDGGLRRLAILWFLIAAAPSVAVVLADFSVLAVAEHRFYLAMVGLALLVAAELTRRPALLTSRTARALIIVLLVGLAARTVARNRIWSDDLTLWTAVVEGGTRHAQPHMNLGVALMDAGRMDEAERAFRTALGVTASAQTRQQTLVNLGRLKIDQGALDEAATHLERANAIGPHAIALESLAIIARRHARAQAGAGDAEGAAATRARAERLLAQALAINPRRHQSYFVLGGLAYDRRDLTAAIAHYRHVVALAPDTAVGRDAAEALRQLGAARAPSAVGGHGG